MSSITQTRLLYRKNQPLDRSERRCPHLRSPRQTGSSVKVVDQIERVGDPRHNRQRIMDGAVQYLGGMSVLGKPPRSEGSV